MCINDMSLCVVPSCRCSGASLSSPLIHDDEAKTVSNIEFHNLYPPSYCPSIPIVVAPSPAYGEQPAPSFKGAGNPDYTQQPPDHVIDYWYHQLGLSVQTPSAETLSNSTTLPSSFPAPPFPVLDEIGSRVSMEFIISHWIGFVFEMYACFEGGLLTDFR
jgi:hypothetical protein